MNDHSAGLANSPFFAGISEDNIEEMLTCLSARRKSYKKGEFILTAGDTTDSVGMVVSGSILVVKEDYWGNRFILSEMGPGMIFAETYACLATVPLEVTVEASSDCEILFLNFNKILTTCSNACEFHARLIHNLTTILASRNKMLTKKLEHMSQKTIRDKLLSYFSDMSISCGSPTFTIPFNRQQLADYLSSDRSALSTELGKLQKEGVIKVSKNTFTLL